MNTTPHNPDNLTPEQVSVEDGWRLLDEDEITDPPCEFLVSISLWQRGKWERGANGHWKDTTYRTKLSRTELRHARGLPDEPQPTSEVDELREANRHFLEQCASLGKENETLAASVLTMRTALEEIANHRGTMDCIPLERHASKSLSAAPDLSQWVKRDQITQEHLDAASAGMVWKGEAESLRAQLAAVTKERDEATAKAEELEQCGTGAYWRRRHAQETGELHPKLMQAEDRRNELDRQKADLDSANAASNEAMRERDLALAERAWKEGWNLCGTDCIAAVSGDHPAGLASSWAASDIRRQITEGRGE